MAGGDRLKWDKYLEMNWRVFDNYCYFYNEKIRKRNQTLSSKKTNEELMVALLQILANQ